MDKFNSNSQKRIVKTLYLSLWVSDEMQISTNAIDISEKQCRDAIGRVSTSVVDNAQLISGDVYCQTVHLQPLVSGNHRRR